MVNTIIVNYWQACVISMRTAAMREVSHASFPFASSPGNATGVTRSWARADWRTRKELVRTANWLVTMYGSAPHLQG
jgi:hypothetical protein